MSCKVDGCETIKIMALGFCSKHYKRDYKKKNPEYSSWECMKARCFNPKNKKYHRYGGRGVTVCKEWKNDFQQFLKDMGSKPFPGAHIDREENNGNYEPSNCHWVSLQVNNRNKENTKLDIHKARAIRSIYKENIVTSRALAKMFGVNKSTILAIVNNVKWKELTNVFKAPPTTA